MDCTYGNTSVTDINGAFYPNAEDVCLLADLRSPWVNDGTDKDDAIAWMASGRGPTPEEWGGIWERAVSEYGDRMAEREDAMRCA